MNAIKKYQQWILLLKPYKMKKSNWKDKYLLRNKKLKELVKSMKINYLKQANKIQKWQ